MLLLFLLVGTLLASSDPSCEGSLELFWSTRQFVPSVCFHPEGQRAHEALRKVATSFSLQKDYAWFWRRSAITCGCSVAIKCPQPAATRAVTLRHPNFLVSSLAVGPGLPEPIWSPSMRKRGTSSSSR